MSRLVKVFQCYEKLLHKSEILGYDSGADEDSSLPECEILLNGKLLQAFGTRLIFATLGFTILVLEPLDPGEGTCMLLRNVGNCSTVDTV